MALAERLRRRRGRGSSGGPVPDSTGPDEPTVRIASREFRRRRRRGWWQRLRLALIALLVMAALGAGVWLVFFSGHVTAEELEITGNETVRDVRIERAARVDPSTPLARVDLDDVRDRVESITAVRRAEVSRSWPHTVRIEVTERVPVAVIDRGNGLQSLDAEGVRFGRHASRPDRLPLVRTEPDTDEEAMVESGRVVASLPGHLAARVDVVEVSSVDRIELVLHNGRRVLWGSAEDSEQKAEVLAVLLRQPGRHIDVSVPGRPTTR